jgi:hypothetical protein
VACVFYIGVFRAGRSLGPKCVHKCFFTVRFEVLTAVRIRIMALGVTPCNWYIGTNV